MAMVDLLQYKVHPFTLRTENLQMNILSFCDLLFVSLIEREALQKQPS